MIGLIPKFSGEVIVSEHVHKETLAGKIKGYRDAFYRDELVKEGKIKVEDVRKDAIVQAMKETGLRKKVDASVIALAREKGGLILTEDPHIYHASLYAGLPVAKTSDVIVFLVELGLLERKRAEEVLRLLEIKGYDMDALREARKTLEAI